MKTNNAKASIQSCMTEPICLDRLVYRNSRYNKLCFKLCLQLYENFFIFITNSLHIFRFCKHFYKRKKVFNLDRSEKYPLSMYVYMYIRVSILIYNVLSPYQSLANFNFSVQIQNLYMYSIMFPVSVLGSRICNNLA